jgi:hypothetical protein
MEKFERQKLAKVFGGQMQKKDNRHEEKYY